MMCMCSDPRLCARTGECQVVVRQRAALQAAIATPFVLVLGMWIAALLQAAPAAPARKPEPAVIERRQMPDGWTLEEAEGS